MVHPPDREGEWKGRRTHRFIAESASQHPGNNFPAVSVICFNIVPNYIFLLEKNKEKSENKKVKKHNRDGENKTAHS